MHERFAIGEVKRMSNKQMGYFDSLFTLHLILFTSWRLLDPPFLVEDLGLGALVSAEFLGEA